MSTSTRHGVLVLDLCGLLVSCGGGNHGGVTDVTPETVPLADAVDVIVEVTSADADTTSFDTPCIPNCDGKECGDDGCGGSCGVCDGCGNDDSGELYECQGGQCPYCCPNCAHPGMGFKPCGEDGCQGLCGVCTDQEVCVWKNGHGVCLPCAEDCAGAECGYDCSGSSCGQCGSWDECVDMECIECVPADCTDRECGDDGCGGSCGECGAKEGCVFDYLKYFESAPEEPFTCVPCVELICGDPWHFCVDIDHQWGNGNEIDVASECAYYCLEPWDGPIAEGTCAEVPK